MGSLPSSLPGLNLARPRRVGQTQLESKEGGDSLEETTVAKGG